MDKETKETLASLAENLIAVTNTAYRATQMALGAMTFISNRHPNFKDEYEKIIDGADKLHAERAEQARVLNSLLEKIRSL